MRKARRYCSFCGVHLDAVELMIAGPDAVFICAACVDVCVTRMAQARAAAEVAGAARAESLEGSAGRIGAP